MIHVKSISTMLENVDVIVMNEIEAHFFMKDIIPLNLAVYLMIILLVIINPLI